MAPSSLALSLPLSLSLSLLLFSPLASGALRYSQLNGAPYNVSYDARSLRINEVPFLALSGSVHYPRATPVMWPGIFAKARENNLNTIQTYVFWNAHEAVQGVYDFSERLNLQAFLQAAANADLFVNLRIGPYVCSEWDYGGLPAWLNEIPDMALRTYNTPFMNAMSGWVRGLVAHVRPFFADHGGPIILAQIENEYSPTSPEDEQYVTWVGQLADSLQVNVPWIMCNGAAANNTIETCNGCECEAWISQHVKDHPLQPAWWTENWLGWVQRWGYPYSTRSPQALAGAVLRFISAGGSLNNYYMWYSGNNYALTAGSSVTTRYGDEPMLRADGAYHEPIYSHVGRMHAVLEAVAEVLLAQPPPPQAALAHNITLRLYHAAAGQQAVAFLLSRSPDNVTLTYNKTTLTLAPDAVAIVQGGSVLFNTGEVEEPKHPNIRPQMLFSLQDWKWWADPSIYTQLQHVVSAPAPLEQLRLTNDTSEYLFYAFNVTLKAGSYKLFLPTASSSSFVVFCNGKFVDEVNDHSHDAYNVTLNVHVPLNDTGLAQFLLMSVSLGIPNYFDHRHLLYKGLLGLPLINDSPVHTEGGFSMLPKTPGEWLGLPSGSANVSWSDDVEAGIGKQRLWWTTQFKTPASLSALGLHLNLTGFQRGHVWVNGHSVGKYWIIVGDCNPSQLFCEEEDVSTCGLPSQALYHVPVEWLAAPGATNTIVLYEELGCSAPILSGVWAREVS